MQYPYCFAASDSVVFGLGDVDEDDWCSLSRLLALAAAADGDAAAANFEAEILRAL